MNRYRLAGFGLASLVGLALFTEACSPVRAEVVSLTVGLNTSCPYGVPN